MNEAPEVMPAQVRPLSFAELMDFRDFASQQSPEIAQMSIPQFADVMNKATGSALFDAGKSGVLGKRISYTIDKLFKPVANLTGPVMRDVFGSLFGPEYEATGMKAGEGLPRFMAEMLPVMKGYQIANAGSKLFGGALMGLGGLSAGLKGYEETGSPAVGAIQGASMAFLGPTARAGEALVAPAVRRVSSALPELAGDIIGRGIEEGGRQLAFAANQELATQASSLAQGQGFVDPFTKQHMVEMFGAQVPFLVLDIPRVIRGPGKVRSPFPGEEGRLRDFPTATAYYDAIKQATEMKASAAQTAKDSALRTLQTPEADTTLEDVLEGVPYVNIQGIPVKPSLLGKLDQVTSFLRNNPEVSPLQITKAYGVGLHDANTILAVLEAKGLIAPRDQATGTSKVLQAGQTEADLLTQVKNKTGGGNNGQKEGQTLLAPKSVDPNDFVRRRIEGLQKWRGVLQETIDQGQVDIPGGEAPGAPAADSLATLDKEILALSHKLEGKGVEGTTGVEGLPEVSGRPFHVKEGLWTFVSPSKETKTNPSMPLAYPDKPAPSTRVVKVATASEVAERLRSLEVWYQHNATEEALGRVDIRSPQDKLRFWFEQNQLLREIEFLRGIDEGKFKGQLVERYETSLGEQPKETKLYAEQLKQLVKDKLLATPPPDLQRLSPVEALGQIHRLLKTVRETVRLALLGDVGGGLEIERVVKPAGMWTDEMYSQWLSAQIKSGVPVDEAVARLYNKMMDSVEVGVRLLEQQNQRVLMTELGMMAKLEEYAPEAAAILRQASPAKWASDPVMVDTLERMISDKKLGGSTRGELVNLLKQRARIISDMSHLDKLPAFLQQQLVDTISLFYQTRTPATGMKVLDLGDYLLAAAGRWVKTREETIRTWKERHKETVQRLIKERSAEATEQALSAETPVPEGQMYDAVTRSVDEEIERQAFHSRITQEAYKDMLDVYKRNATVFDYTVAPEWTQSESDILREYNPEDAVTMQADPEKAAEAAADNSRIQAFRDWVINEMLPKAQPDATGKLRITLSPEQWNAGLSSPMGGRPFIRSVAKDMTARLNTALQMFLDGELGFRLKKGSDTEFELFTTTHYGDEQLNKIFGYQFDPTKPNKQGQDFLARGLNQAGRDRVSFVNAFRGLVHEVRSGRLRLRWDDPSAPKSVAPAEGAIKRSAALAAHGLPQSVDRPLITSESGKNLVVGTTHYFSTLFRKMGMSEEKVRLNTEVATRLAVMFDRVGYVRIADLLNDGDALGQMYGNRGYRSNAFVGLSMDKLEAIFNTPALKVFAAYQVAAHEFTHSVFDQTQAIDPQFLGTVVAPARHWAERLLPEERMEIIRQQMYMLIPLELRKGAGMDWIETRMNQAFDSPSEFLADYAANLVVGMASPDGSSTKAAAQDLVRFAGPDLGQFTKGLFVSLGEITEAVARYHEKMNVDRGFIWRRPDTGLAIRELDATIKKAINTDFAEVEKASKVFLEMQTNDPVGWAEKVSKAYLGRLSQAKLDAWWMETAPWHRSFSIAPQERSTFKGWLAQAQEAMGLQSRAAMKAEFGKVPWWHEWALWPSAQLANKYAELRKPFNLAYDFRGEANKKQLEMLFPFLSVSKLGRPVLDTEAHNLRAALTDPVLIKAIRRVASLKQVNEKVLTDAEIEAALPGLSPEKLAIVKDMHRGIEQTMVKAANLLVRGYEDKAVMQIAQRLILRKGDMPAELAKQVAAAIYYGPEWSASPDPAAAARGLDAMNKALGMLEPDTQAEMIQQAGSARESITKLRTELSNRPWYVPLARKGRFKVSAPPKAGDTVGYVETFETIEEAHEVAGVLRKQGRAAKVVDQGGAQPTGESAVFPQAVMDAAMRVEAASLARAKEQYDLMAGTDVFRQVDWEQFSYKPLDAVMRERAARSHQRFLLRRKGRDVSEYANVMSDVLDYVVAVANGLTKGKTKEELALMLQEAPLKQNPKLREIAKNHVLTVIDPPAREWTTFKNGVFAYYLGFNLSSMLIELSQPLISVVPQLTRYTGGMMEGYRRLADATQEMIGATKGAYSYKELGEAVSRAQEEQVIDFGIMQEFHLDNDLALVNLRNLTDGDNQVARAVDLAKKPIYWYMAWAKNLYSMSTRTNSRLAFIAAYKQAFEHGVLRDGQRVKLNKDEAYDFAKQVVRETLFGGGAAARPGIFTIGKGHFVGPLGAMYSLQSYTASMFAMFMRMGQEAIRSLGKQPGVSPADVRAARKAFGQMAITQFAMAGALGMPMAAGIAAVIEQLFPEAEVKKGVREAFYALGETAGMGSFVADLAMSGVIPASATAAGLPSPDVGPRLSLGSFLGVDPYEGFSIGNVVGPGAGAIENIFKGVKSASMGEFQTAGRQILPRAYKGLVDTIGNGGAVRDMQGRLVLGMSPAEQLMSAIGLTPKAVRDVKDKESLIRRSEEVARLQHRRMIDDLSDQVIAGDTRGAMQKMMEWQRDNPVLHNARALAQTVASRVIEKTTPADPTSSGVRSNAAERSRIEALFPGQQPRTSEVERVMAQKRIEQALGVVSPITPAQMQSATMLDQLQRSMPFLTRQEAAAMLQQQRHPLATSLVGQAPLMQ